MHMRKNVLILSFFAAFQCISVFSVKAHSISKSSFELISNTYIQYVGGEDLDVYNSDYDPPYGNKNSSHYEKEYYDYYDENRDVSHGYFEGSDNDCDY